MEMENTHEAKIKFFQQRDFGEKFNVTIDFLKENFKPLFKILLMIEGPLIAIASVLSVIQQQNMMEMMSTVNQNENPFGVMGSLGTSYSLATLLSLVIMCTFPAIVIRYVFVYQNKSPETITIKDILPTLFRDSGMLFAVTLMYGIAIMIGMFIFIFPGIYFLIGFSLAYPIIFFEDKNAFDGMSRSLTLIRDNWWSTCGFLFVLYIIQMAISMLFMAPQIGVYFKQMLTTFEAADTFEPMSTTDMLINMLVTAVGTLGAYLVYTIGTIGICFQYFNLREQKESFGLMQQIDNLETE